jgi:hypothetical protein
VVAAAVVAVVAAAVVAQAAACRGALAACAEAGALPTQLNKRDVMAGFDQVDPANSCPLCGSSIAQVSKLASRLAGLQGKRKMLARGLDAISSGRKMHRAAIHLIGAMCVLTR